MPSKRFKSKPQYNIQPFKNNCMVSHILAGLATNVNVYLSIYPFSIHLLFAVAAGGSLWTLLVQYLPLLNKLHVKKVSKSNQKFFLQSSLSFTLCTKFLHSNSIRTIQQQESYFQEKQTFSELFFKTNNDRQSFKVEGPINFSTWRHYIQT